MDAYTYPQRSRPPATPAGECECKEGRALAAVKKQQSRNPMPLVERPLQTENKQPLESEAANEASKI